MIPEAAVEAAAYLSTAFIGVCDVHAERSAYGLAIGDAEVWVAEHNAESHRPTP